MNCLTYAIALNIKRFQNLLETSVDETERKTIQRLIDEEEAKYDAHFTADGCRPATAPPPG